MDSTKDLAQECEEPGLWLIEGIQVRRKRSNHGSTRWVIVWEPGVRVETVVSLDAARRRIVDVINEGDAKWNEMVGLDA